MYDLHIFLSHATVGSKISVTGLRLDAAGCWRFELRLLNADGEVLSDCKCKTDGAGDGLQTLQGTVLAGRAQFSMHKYSVALEEHSKCTPAIIEPARSYISKYITRELHQILAARAAAKEAAKAAKSAAKALAEVAAELASSENPVPWAEEFAEAA